MTAARRTPLHMAAAFVAMGGWAAWANSAHPMPAPLLAGAVQGSLSALITLGLKRMVEALVARVPGRAGLLAAPAAACLLSLALLSSLHRIAGTPEIAATLAVPTTVATLYAAVYAAHLRRHRHG